jgi:hypothetical protein
VPAGPSSRNRARRSSLTCRHVRAAVEIHGLSHGAIARLEGTKSANRGFLHRGVCCELTFRGCRPTTICGGQADGRRYSHRAHHLVHRDAVRRYHEVGHAVFLQLGVIFAVLLAFVFNNVWSDYNVASQAIDSECASLHGIAILSDRLPSPARDAILDDLHAYLTTVLEREWPEMQRRKRSRTAAARFQLLWQTVETVNTDPADNQIRGQLLSLLAAAHQSRETRLFQMEQSVPGLIWSVLIIFASGLIGCMLVFAAKASISKAVLVGVFTSSLTLALLTVYVLDYPFESALQLPSRDFNETLEKVEHLIAAAQQGGSRVRVAHYWRATSCLHR